MKPFEDFILMLTSSPQGRVFFCKTSMYESLDPCVSINILRRNSVYTLFESSIPSIRCTPREAACHFQTCKYCKGYGIVKSTQVFNSIYTLGLTPFRQIPLDWDEYFQRPALFEYLLNVYNQSSCENTLCVSCFMKEECSLKLARRKCVPILNPRDSLGIRSPYFDPPAKVGIFPFLQGSTARGESFWLCYNNKMKIQSSGCTVQSGMGDKPRFYIAPIKNVVSRIVIPQTVWELGYQYAITRYYKFGLPIKPFILTPHINKQICFGSGFRKVEDYSDFLWRTRPLLQVVFRSKVEDLKATKREVIPWNLYYRAVENIKDTLADRITIGLCRIFGYLPGNYNGGPRFEFRDQEGYYITSLF
jgi:hypothetical protein